MLNKLLLPVFVLIMNQCLSQVCPTATFNTQYNQTTNLGGAGENPIANPFTYSYTPGPGANRLMLLFVTYETENNNGPNNFAAATYGGVALTNVVNQTVVAAGTQQNRLAIYYLKEAGINSRIGNTVSISFTNPGGTSPNGSINGVAVNTLMFENVHQVTPLLNIKNATNTNTVTITVPASFIATAGNYVIAAVNMALATATVGPSTPDYTVYISQQVAGSHTHSVSYKSIVTTGAEQPGFTANVSTRQIIGSVEVKALTTGGSCAGGLVPVKIFSFSGNKINNTVKLIWKTNNETNLSVYNIQRSTADASSFTTIGTIAARNQPLTTEYVFNDIHSTERNTFYRLQAVDIDGLVSYSNIIRINADKNDIQLRVLSPFNKALQLFVSSDLRKSGRLNISDNAGRMIFEQDITMEAGENTITLDIYKYLAPGVYFISLHTSEGKYICKAIKQ